MKYTNVFRDSDPPYRARPWTLELDFPNGKKMIWDYYTTKKQALGVAQVHESIRANEIKKEM